RQNVLESNAQRRLEAVDVLPRDHEIESAALAARAQSVDAAVLGERVDRDVDLFDVQVRLERELRLAEAVADVERRREDVRARRALRDRVDARRVRIERRILDVARDVVVERLRSERNAQGTA